MDNNEISVRKLQANADMINAKWSEKTAYREKDRRGEGNWLGYR
jgi:hypothetical protein